jgi:hypothetical protein
MSTDFFSWTFPTDNCDSGRTPPLADVNARMSSAEAKDQILMTTSRNMWLEGNLRTITAHGPASRHSPPRHHELV